MASERDLWVTDARHLAPDETGEPGETVVEGEHLTDPSTPAGRVAFKLGQSPVDPVAAAAELGVDIEEFHQG